MEKEYKIHKNKIIKCTCGKEYKLKCFKIYLRNIESNTHEAEDCLDTLIKNCKCGRIINLSVPSTINERLIFNYSKDCSNFRPKYHKNGYYYIQSGKGAFPRLKYKKIFSKCCIEISELDYKKIHIYFVDFSKRRIEKIYNYLLKNNIKFKKYPACIEILSKRKKDGIKIVEDIINIT